MTKREVTQEELMYAINQADIFYKGIHTGVVPMLTQIQALLRIVGIDEPLERLKAVSDDMADAEERAEESTVSFAPGDLVEIEATGIVESVSGSGCVVRVHGELVPMGWIGLKKVGD